MSGVPTTVAAGAYCALVWRTGRMPRWTAVLAAVAAVAHLMLLASFVVRDGFFSLQGQVISAIPATLFIWILGDEPGAARAARRYCTEGDARALSQEFLKDRLHGATSCAG